MRRTHARSVEHPALEKGFIQDSAVSAELAVDFALRQNVEHNYRREAREVDHRRGALSQVAHLDLDYPDIAPHPPLPAVETLLEHFDLATVIKVSEAVSGEIVLGDLIETIAAARFNVCAALNFLDKQPPDQSEVREALGCIIDDANRAGDIIDRIRDHLKKAPPRQDRFDLNEAINEVIELVKCAISDNGVSIQIRLTESMTPVQGDRAQVQQVVLNLILNAIVSQAVSGEIVLGDLIETIAAARFNVCAALNFLDKQPPDLGEVREALGCIIDDADRAGNIIDRIRDHIKKAPPSTKCRGPRRPSDSGWGAAA